MAKEFYTVEVISHPDDEAYEVRIDRGGGGKSSMARCLCLEQPPIAIVEDMEAISAVGCPYVSDLVDISYIVNLCRLDRLDAHRILRQIDDAGSAVFEVTAAYLLSQSI